MLYFLSDGAALNPYGTEAVYELAIEPGAGRPMNIVSAAPSGLPVDFLLGAARARRRLLLPILSRRRARPLALERIFQVQK